jgi:hypothetical protein
VELEVVFAAFVFFVFVAFVFFIFVALVVSCPAVSCANTGIASEKTIKLVNNIVRSFFMLGLDLLRNYFLSGFEQGRGHNAISYVTYLHIYDM